MINTPLLKIDNLKVQPLYWVNENNSVLQSNSSCVTDGITNYGTVGGRYKPISYKDVLLKVQEDLNQEFEITNWTTNKDYSKGTLGGRINHPKSLVGVEEVELNINIVNSLNGSSTIGIIVTPIRVINKTQYTLIDNKGFISLNYRHTNHGITNFSKNNSLFKEILNSFDDQVKTSTLLQYIKISTVEGERFLIKMHVDGVIGERMVTKANTLWTLSCKEENQGRNLWVLFGCLTTVVNIDMNNKHEWCKISELNKIGKYFKRMA